MMNLIKNFLITSLFLFGLLITVRIPIADCREPIKKLLLIGGGGEASGDTTRFDYDFKEMGIFFNNSDWQSTISLNGGHKKTEEIIHNQFTKSKNEGPFIQQTYNKLLSDMIAELKSGKLTEKDQLMIIIDSHGTKKEKDEDTHQIAIGTGDVSLDSLKELIDLAAEKSVKLAIVDLSCYSGNTLNIKNDKVCMISSTGPDFSSYGSLRGFFGRKFTSFSGALFDSLKKDKNLEELFLNAIQNADQPGNDIPMISTPEGRAVHALIYDLIKPFMYENINPLDLQVNRLYQTNEIENLVCRLDENLRDLKELFALTANAQTAATYIKEFKDLNQALDKYRKYQKAYEADLRIENAINLEFKQILALKYPSELKRIGNSRAKIFLTTDWEKVSLNLYSPDMIKANTLSSFDIEWIQQMKIDSEIQKDILSKLKPNQIDVLKRISDMEKPNGRSWELAQQVGKAARKVFPEIYRQNRQSTSNPCRDFKL